MMRPLIDEGDYIDLFGVRARVIQVVPENDWTWQVTLSAVSVLGNSEVWTISVPTDFRTTDGLDVRQS